MSMSGRDVACGAVGAALALGVIGVLNGVVPAALAAASSPSPSSAPRTGHPSLEGRLLLLEDKDAIRDLLTSYGKLLDSGDWVGYSKLFARQGTWTGSFGTATGPDEILAMLRKSMGAVPAYNPDKVRSLHLLTNYVIQVDGDRATATSRWTNFARTDDNKLVPRLAGHYEDVLVREDGRWKFLSRQAPRDIPNPETAAEAGKAP
jgi:uncharacterized protein (TIGR02246 family)